MEKIKLGKYVQLAYEIFIGDDQNETSVFKFTTEQPDSFVFGLDQTMIPGFMKGVEGLAAGDKFDFKLEPDEAFGQKDPNMVMELPRETFHNGDGEFDNERVFVGAMLPMQTQDGYRIDGLVTHMTDTAVTMDFNHQLAGERVHYVGQVVSVRDATPEELTPAHGCGGCGGHHHDHSGGCGCDGCDGCS